MAISKRILLITLLLTGVLCVSACHPAQSNSPAKVPGTGKNKPAACCTGKTPPRFGLKSPANIQREDLDSIAKSAIN